VRDTFAFGEKVKKKITPTEIGKRKKLCFKRRRGNLHWE